MARAVGAQRCRHHRLTSVGPRHVQLIARFSKSFDVIHERYDLNAALVFARICVAPYVPGIRNRAAVA